MVNNLSDLKRTVSDVRARRERLVEEMRDLDERALTEARALRAHYLGLVKEIEADFPALVGAKRKVHGNTGRHLSEATKRRLSEAQMASWRRRREAQVAATA